MEVKLGWSQEINGQWAKLDVIIQEIDIQRLLIENGLKPEDAVQLKAVDAFRLMESMAEINIMVHQMTEFKEFYNTPQNGAALQAYVATRQKIIVALKEKVIPF